MGALLQTILKPILRPLTRILVGAIAIPIFRLFMQKVVRVTLVDAELKKDLEQWFRASLVLLMATANMEDFIFGYSRVEFGHNDPLGVFLIGLRLLLAVGVIEMMPDQELFAIIHPGPPRIVLDKAKSFRENVLDYLWPVGRGLVCQHLHRSSPVFAILCAVFPGGIGWFCYGMALAQYLIIGLVTSKDKALDALAEFDRQVAIRRRNLIEEFDYTQQQIESRRNEAAASISDPEPDDS